MLRTKEEILYAAENSESSFEAARLLGINQKTYKKYALELGCYKTNQHGKGTHRKSGIATNTIVNERCFERITTSSAYYLGFIAADGIVRGCTLKINISRKDKKQLEKICDFMCCPRSYIIDYTARYNGNSYPASSFKVTSKKVIDSLEKYNIVPNKSHLDNDLFENIPDKYKSAWLAGYIDGDGSISMRYTISIVSNKSTIKSIISYYKDHYDIDYSRLKTKNGLTYYLDYYKKDTSVYIVKDYVTSCTIQMDRKYKEACALLGRYYISLERQTRKRTRIAQKNKHQMKTMSHRPDIEILQKDIFTLPFTTIGAKYGVSDNAVRKWCKYYGLPYRKKDIKIINAGSTPAERT